ncbi:MAG: prolyl oligopeptidase family serine peptidase [Cyclobacteriaceae bacterium]|nr:prolyl oligopeptidase family serine peptidase [Cyclobacteriaceae bacterium]
MVSAGVKAFSQNSYPEFVKQIFISGNDTLPYRLLQPEKAKSGKKYPLIIFLHGAGERGRDNEANLKYITDLFLNPYNRKKFPAFVMVPQCPQQKWWAPQNWSDKPASPADLVIRLADDLVKSYPIDVSRIYLMGLSMGGNGTWYLLTRYPDRFAAGVPICGWGNRELIPAMKDIPVWAFHGDKDPVVPAEKSRELISALQNAGGHPRYTEYKDTGHDSWTPALNEPELLKWLFSFKRPRK